MMLRQKSFTSRQIMTDPLLSSIQSTLARETATPLAPGLYIVATPIGNLADITLRALAVLARATHVLCEDTRHSLKLLNHYGIARRLTAYHDHNADRERPKILEWLREGAAVALISDAGTPLISDPGYKLVRDAAAEGIAVLSIPGPSAVVAALAASGLPTDSFFFAGFLPAREAAARRRLAGLAAIPGTLIFFETATRLEGTLDALGELFPGREAVIARELTKRFEEFIRGPLPLARDEKREWKGEFVLLISPPVPQDASQDELENALGSALQRLSARDAVEEVARTFGVPKRMVYNLALQLQKGATHVGDE